MKYLFIGAHTDDIELAAAGTITQLLRAGHEVRCYTFSYLNRLQLLSEHTNAMESLGIQNWVANTYDNRIMSYYRQAILENLLEYKETYLPDVVFTHSPDDIHQDHQTVAMESIRAFKNNCTIITYMMPWNGQLAANMFIPLTLEDVGKKVEVLQHYQSQSFRHYMAEDSIRQNSSTARWPGYHYMESFQIIQLFGNSYQ